MPRFFLLPLHTLFILLQTPPCTAVLLAIS